MVVCLLWYTIRGSNEMEAVGHIEKWRFEALPTLTYPRNYPRHQFYTFILTCSVDTIDDK